MREVLIMENYDEYEDDFDFDIDLDTRENFKMEKDNDSEFIESINTADLMKNALDEELDLPEKFSGGFNKSFEVLPTKSIVPDGIRHIRVVGLMYNNEIIAYRVKTDKGNFDMTLDSLSRYGIGGFKIEKVIKLDRVNGMIMSASERKNKRLVPDISKNEEDCRKIYNLLFSC